MERTNTDETRDTPTTAPEAKPKEAPAWLKQMEDATETIRRSEAVGRRIEAELKEDEPKIGAIFAEVAAQIRASADRQPSLQELEELATDAKVISAAAKALLAEPVSEATRKNQERLLLVAMLSLLLCSGLVLFKEVKVADVGLEFTKTWTIAAAATLICFYYTSAFFISYLRDMRLHATLRWLPNIQLQTILCSITALNADKAERHILENQGLQNNESQPDSPEQRLRESQRRLRESQHLLNRQQGITKLLRRARSQDRWRAVVDLVFPLATGLLALIVTVRYVLKALGFI